MIVDFRRKPNNIPDLFINGEKVERVNEYKYLGTIVDNKLTFNSNTQAIHKKCQSRLYCLQKLRSLHVRQSILCTFYRCFIESVLTFGFVCWFGGLNVRNKSVLNKVVNVCGRVVGEKQESLGMLYESRVARKARTIVRDKNHVLARHFDLLPSGRRFRTPKTSTLRAKRAFVPSSIEILNRQ